MPKNDPITMVALIVIILFVFYGMELATRRYPRVRDVLSGAVIVSALVVIWSRLSNNSDEELQADAPQTDKVNHEPDIIIPKTLELERQVITEEAELDSVPDDDLDDLLDAFDKRANEE